jgi:phytoene dehydrogenase-like protein
MSDAIIIGSGPNGLAAAIVLARAGLSVTVYEAASQIGGGTRSGQLTLPGFVHDVCSSIHPFAVASPFLRGLPLAEHGLEWVHPELPLAHPFDDGTAAFLERSVDATDAGLGETGSWRRLMAPLVNDWEGLLEAVLGPPRWPRNPLAMARFGVRALLPASVLAKVAFSRAKARGMFAGLAGHSTLPLESPVSAAFGMLLAACGHAVGWPFPRGGAQHIADALASYLCTLGGKIETGARVNSLDELPPARAVLCEITPRQLLKIGGKRLPDWYRRKLERFRYGSGAFKVDWALDAPIPWTAEACRRAGTLHLGGMFEEIAVSERAAWNGHHADRPFVLLAQHTLFDATRAPADKHTAWGYCHVPNGSTVHMLDRIEAQIERFAPGFRERILGRSVMSPAALEEHNPNLVGGDIGGGAPNLPQLFLRPTAQMYRTPVKGLYLCSSSTPPGGGVHGMCGYWAAKWALEDIFNSERSANS